MTLDSRKRTPPAPSIFDAIARFVTPAEIG